MTLLEGSLTKIIANENTNSLLKLNAIYNDSLTRSVAMYISLNESQKYDT